MNILVINGSPKGEYSSNRLPSGRYETAKHDRLFLQDCPLQNKNC